MQFKTIHAFLSFFVIVFFLKFIYFDDLHKNKFKKNYESIIYGVLEEDVWGSSGGERLKVNGVSHVIPWMYIVSGRSISFSNIGKVGDTIKKAAYSDTIFLNKRNGKKYIFYFKEPGW